MEISKYTDKFWVNLKIYKTQKKYRKSSFLKIYKNGNFEMSYPEFAGATIRRSYDSFDN